ncbi:multidrug effflux MFS transporter [Frankia nepalensis]|uniref:multidrug effflux MFS transporter n=1 Tax=Frankia nepalensis TaxID=1836974 RepID=UPI0027DC9709|nr:multidrug effflux MFS transporter [Frankia nepalensis]
MRPESGRVGPLILVLGLLTAFSPLAIDMYIPGFPELGTTLHASDSAVQLSMTTFLAGIVLGQLFIGPISDSLGRRRLLLGGTGLVTVLSLVCAAAPNIETLVAARFLQGVAAAAGMVLARAVVTDRFHGPDLPRYFALLAMILGVAPIVAPLLGSLVLSVSSWRAVFVVLAVIGAALTATVALAVPESLPAKRRHTGGLGGTFAAMGRLLTRRAFVGYLLTGAFMAGALFTYISGSSFVFVRIFDTSTATYSLVFATNAAAMLAANTLFGRLSRRHRLNTLLAVAVAVAVAGAALQGLLLLTVGATMAGTWVCLIIILAGAGMSFPATMTLNQSLGRDNAGAAAALQGSGQFAAGAIGAPLVGVFGSTSVTPMAVIMLVSLVCAALALLTLARPWLGAGELRLAASQLPAPAGSGQIAGQAG